MTAEGAELVLRDVDHCFAAVAGRIPPRLSIPALLGATPNLLTLGMPAASRFADLLSDVWQALDRPTVVAHLNSLCVLATLMLDYRRVQSTGVMGGSSNSSSSVGDSNSNSNSISNSVSISSEARRDLDQVGESVSGAIVELCLKLTEVELRSFLQRLSQWRDARIVDSTEASSSSTSSSSALGEVARSNSFYSLVHALGNRLKSIFVPTMSIVWAHAADQLAGLETVVSSQDASLGTSRSSKKQKKKGRKRRIEDDGKGVNCSLQFYSSLLYISIF